MRESKPSDKLTRRGFLRGSLVVGASAAVVPQAVADDALQGTVGGASDVPKQDAVAVDCTVNGVQQRFSAGPDDSAVAALRQRLGLTGAKIGCGHGACGACTVLVDGRPQVSCLLPAMALNGRSIQTVEGLSGDGSSGALHAVQRAFAGEDALQCGYCTPGFVVESAAFVDRWRVDKGRLRPSRDEIAAALSGHICRCGAYENIYAAVAAACEGRYDRPGVDAQRVDALAKITGQARYTVDVQLKGQLVGRMRRAGVSHGVLRKLDLSAARRVAGVKAVVPLAKDGDKVRYAGQELAAVAAIDAASAQAGLDAILVEIEALKPVVGMTQARRADAPVIFPDGDKGAGAAAEMPVLKAGWSGNVRGPVSSALLSRHKAAGKLLDQRSATEAPDSPTYLSVTSTLHCQAHSALEPHCAVARWTTDGGLEVWASTQSVRWLAEDIAERFKLKHDAVTVHADYVGGGFGAKVGLQIEGLAAILLARECGAPVGLVLDRAEDIETGGCRPAQEVTVSLAVDPTGALEAMGVDAFADTGVSIGANVGMLARIMYPTPYKRLRDWDVTTNSGAARPFRGPGGPPAFFGLETAIDELANRRGVDPIKLRRRWDPNPSRQRLYRWAEGLPLWRDRGEPNRDTGRFRTGVGLASAGWFVFQEPGTRVQLDAGRDGIVATCACQDIGTGSRSVVAHAIASVLDISPHAVEVRFGNSQAVPGPMSAGSRTTASVGPAAEDAARQLIEELTEAGADTLGLGLVTAEKGGLRHAQGFLTWQELLAQLPRVTVVGRRRKDQGGYFLPFPVADMTIGKVLPGAVNIAQVRVDTLLGRVQVTHYAIGVGVGRIYTPKLAENQVQGGVLQGIGYALYEERRQDPGNGRLLSTGLEDYKMAGIGDCPPIDVFFDQEGFEHVPGGGVGLGELCTVGTAAAIANAVAHATGWRPRDLPLRPDRVLAALEAGP